jgi:hypothetical protein
MSYYRLYLLLMLLPFVGAAQEPINNSDQTIQREIAVLKTCEPERCPVFYVRMLGRDFPIPNRYESSNWGTPGFRRYISPARATPKDRYVSGEALIGSILVGPRAEFHEASHAWVLRPLGTIAGVEVFGMSSPDTPNKRFAYILIAGDEYAQIGDQNPQLAELLLKLSERHSKALPASK